MECMWGLMNKMPADGAPEPEGRAARPWARFTLFWLSLCLAAFALAALVPTFGNLSTFFLFRQDRWLLVAATLLLLVSGERLKRRAVPLALPRHAVWIAAAATMLVCYLGHYWILCDYDMSRDEQMAVFDSQIFSSGRLVQPLPPLWQPHADALNTLFMLPVRNPTAWVSAYLPVNAALRSLIALIGDPALTGPLMTALGAIALWNCARLLWPEDREAAVIALLLYLASGQVLLAGMSAYAMPAHLALDLFWLWLFLLNQRSADFAALIVGFLATGLHQPLFHPLFVAPFLLCLLRDKAWPRLIIFVAGYAAISLFWLAWPVGMHALITGPNSTTARIGTDYWSRLRLMLMTGRDPRFIDMPANLLRYVAWQPILLLPLMFAGLASARRGGTAGALAIGILLPIVIMFVIMPRQGHGFGYRYLHGVIGNAVLLAVFGWRHMAASHDWLRPLLQRTILAGLVVILPLQLWMMNNFYAPFATADKRIATSAVDYFIMGEDDAPFAGDLVLNRPDLTNRPVRVLAADLDDPLIAAICRPGISVAVATDSFYQPINGYFGSLPAGVADRRLTRLSVRLAEAGCSVGRFD